MNDLKVSGEKVNTQDTVFVTLPSQSYCNNIIAMWKLLKKTTKVKVDKDSWVP